MNNHPKRLLTVLNHGIADQVPIWMMRQAGRHLPEYRKIRQSVSGFLELCLTPELAAEVTLQPIKRYDFDAAIVFSDILLIPWAMGCEVIFQEGLGIRVTMPPGETWAGLDQRFMVEKLKPVYQTIQLVKKKLSPTTSLIGFVGCPWTLLCYMIEGQSSKSFAKVFEYATKNKNHFKDFINILVRLISEHAKLQIMAGAEVIQLFESWGNLLYADGFRQWSMDPVNQIILSIKKDFPDIPIIFFHPSRGNSVQQIQTNGQMDALSLDSGFEPEWIFNNVDQKFVIQGNLDPRILVEGGKTLEEETDKILKSLHKRPFIFNLGHGVLPETPIEHVEKTIARVRSYRLKN